MNGEEDFQGCYQMCILDCQTPSIISAWHSSHRNFTSAQLVFELSSTRANVLADALSFADESVLVRDQSFQSYRTSGVQLACGDSHFCPEAIAVSIGEAR